MGRRVVPVMLQFHHPGQAPTLDAAAALFGLAAAQVDAAFGVIATDPDAALYTVLVADDAVAAVQQALARRPPHPAEGVFSNPGIAPLGDASAGVA